MFQPALASIIGVNLMRALPANIVQKYKDTYSELRWDVGLRVKWRTRRYKQVVCNFPNWNLDRRYIVLTCVCQQYLNKKLLPGLHLLSQQHGECQCIRTIIFCYDFKHCIRASNFAQLILSKMVAFLTKVALFEVQVIFGIPELLPAPIPVSRGRNLNIIEFLLEITCFSDSSLAM